MTDKEHDILVIKLATCKLNGCEGKNKCFECDNNDIRIINDLTDMEQVIINHDANKYVRQIKKARTRKWWCVLIVIAFAIFISALWYNILFSTPTQSIKDYSPYEFPSEVTKWQREYRTRIARTLSKTDKFVSDINEDNLINCIDFATTFYYIWTASFPGEEHNCEIVRNVNPNTGMNHLFVRTRMLPSSPWECIEPQAPEYGPYFMEDFWPDTYNPIWNIYGETKRWANK